MPVRGAGGEEIGKELTFAVRAIGGIDEDRAKLRGTATWRVLPSLTVGLESNPLVEEVGPLVNWRALDETESRPALIFGTSSDRIGTPHGRSYYGTLSKNLERELGLPVAPYLGAAFGTFDDRLRAIGGLDARLTGDLSATFLWDGVNDHYLLHYRLSDRLVLGFLLADHRYPGLTLAVSFDL